MDELHYVYVTFGVILAYFLGQVLTRRFDPFAPIWLFLVGYTQVYVLQPISYHDWAVQVRGQELVTTANARVLWALLWVLGVYHCGLGRRLAGVLPAPPEAWSVAPVAVLAPILTVWGLISAGMMLHSGDQALSPEAILLRSFHCVLLVAAVLLIVTGRSGPKPRPAVLALGIALGLLYLLIWMYNGKRSHSLMGVLCTTCAFYITKGRRPSWPVLAGVAFTGALVVTLAIGWRGNTNYDRTFAGFVQFAGDLKFEKILKSLNVGEDENTGEYVTHETEEYGGYLLMLDAVPNKSGYDYGSNYLRVFSTFIPRMFWPDKPLFGREEWVNAWIASSEMKRDKDFTGPAIGLLGATQLNGGVWGTVIVLACLGVLINTAYQYFLRYASVPWVQAAWAATFINAWFMVVTDDPMVWFYYNWGFTTMPILIVLWVANKFAVPTTEELVMSAPPAALASRAVRGVSRRCRELRNAIEWNAAHAWHRHAPWSRNRWGQRYQAVSLTEYHYLRDGNPEAYESALIERVLVRGMTVVDVGANHGMFSLEAAHLIGQEGVVHAFEPTPSTRELLEQNLAINDLRNVKVFPSGLGAVSGTGQLRVHHELSGLNTLAARDVQWNRRLVAPDEVIDVPITTLDAHAAREQLERIDFLKIDVEGFELGVIQGARGLLQARRIDRILVEIGDLTCATAGVEPLELLGELHSLDYWLHAISRTGDILERVLSFPETTFSGNYLAVPAERSTPAAWGG